MLKLRELKLRKKQSQRNLRARSRGGASARKFGYDVSVRMYPRTDSQGGTKYTLLGRGKGNPRNATYVCLNRNLTCSPGAANGVVPVKHHEVSFV